MKLYYFRAYPGNFGDDLNLWLWPRLFGRDFNGVCYHDPARREENERETNLFVGIGTLLNRTVPTRPAKIVFGSGAGYGDPARIDARWQIGALRGPLTARALGLPPALGIGDPATLVRMLELPAPAPPAPIGFMPHVQSARTADWRVVCEELGIRYIDPTASPECVLSLLRATDRVITEAMHGAIVCDALRVPWIPVVCYDHINEFKWRDWCATVGLAYEPVRIPSLWPPRDRSLSARLERRVKLHRARKALRSLARSSISFLSSSSALGRVHGQLEAALDELIATDQMQAWLALPRTPSASHASS